MAQSELQNMIARLKSLSDADLRTDEAGILLEEAARLYSQVVTREGFEVRVGQNHTTATDAVVAASALLRSHDLNPFDLTLWFGQAVVKTPIEDRSS